jgi:hypothetical protein
MPRSMKLCAQETDIRMRQTASKPNTKVVNEVNEVNAVSKVLLHMRMP